MHLTQTDNPSSIPPLSFLQAGCPSCQPANSIKALKAKHTHIMSIIQVKLYYTGQPVYAGNPVKNWMIFVAKFYCSVGN